MKPIENITLVVGLWLWQGLAWAEQAPDLSTDQILERHSANSEAFTWVLVKMLFWLLIVCGLAVVVLRWLIPRIANLPLRQPGLVRIVHRISLEPKKSLYVIQAADDYHLIGVADGAISHLTALEKEKVQAHLAQVQTSPAPKSFLQILQDKKNTKEPGT